MEVKGEKSYALLHIYETLQARNAVNRKKMAEKLGVTTKTITRYINDINAYLADESKSMQVKHSRSRGGYVLLDTEADHLNQEDVLAISKILLESRGFNKEELNRLLQKLIGNCLHEDRSMIKKLIQSELANYTQLEHGSNLIQRIWEISRAIQEQHLLEIRYRKVGDDGKVSEEPVLRVVEPQGLLFSEYYFYLVAMISGKPHAYPAIYRLDRIQSYQTLPEKFRVAYRDRFSEGEFRNLIQFMQAGKLQTVVFRFKGESIEAVLDRLPHAEIVEEQSGTYLVQAKTFGRGINMWLLSQGPSVEVLKPLSLRKEMQNLLGEALQKYE